MSSSEVLDAVTVNVTVVPEFSATDDVDVDKLTFGYVVA